MATTPTQSSFGQALQFITDIKLQELEKQRLAYQARAKVIDEVKAMGELEKADILKKVEVLAKAIKSWSGSGSVKDLKIVGGKLNLTNLEFWLQQAKKDPSFSREIAQGWVDTLEEHIRHNLTRFDAAKLFGVLFNEWLASGDSVAIAQQTEADDNDLPDIPVDGESSNFVEVGRKELYEQKEKFQSIVFEDHLVDVEKLKAYLEGLFASEEGTKALVKLRKQIKSFSKHLQREKITTDDVRNSIKGLIADGLMNEGKRSTLKTFEENPTVLDEVASVLNMRMASIDSWSWPKEGILVEFRRHLNGKYRAFSDPEIIDALLLHYIGVAWQVELKDALGNIFDSKAWVRPQPPNAKVREQWNEQLRGDSGNNSIDHIRNVIRREDFFLAQLQDEAGNPTPYHDNDTSEPERKRVKRGPTKASPTEVKQKLLHIMTTDCYLNTALHGTHAIVCSDLEWFGPSLPHTSILTVLEFFGMSKTWLGFYKTFLSCPIRLTGESETRIRKRGTPISYSLSVVCGEAIIFIMDLAVNQRAKGTFLYRMHDDLWLWDADVSKVALGWAEMNIYADLVGLTINQKKTGSAYVGTPSEASATLPKGDIRWGFLKFDATESRFLIDQADVDLYITEMRRQLASTKSVFGWVNAYNKYMTFFMRNFGGLPANCFSKAHIVSLIDTLARIQRELFPESDGGGAVSYLRKFLKDRFEVTDLPEGYFFFSISRGGLEVRNAMLELLALEKKDKPLATYGDKKVANEEDEDDDDVDSKVASYNIDEDDDDDMEDSSFVGDAEGYENSDWTSDSSSVSKTLDKEDTFDVDKVTAEEIFTKRIEHDSKEYKIMKEVWDLDSDNRRAKRHVLQLGSDKFMTFEEFTSLRESWRCTWGISYRHMLSSPDVRHVAIVPTIRQLVDIPGSPKYWESMDWYEKWVISLYGPEFVKKYGSLEAVDPNLIPVGMVELFRSSRMKLDQ